MTGRAPRRAAVFDPSFSEDLRYWIETDRRTAKRLPDLVEAVLRDPLAGIGKPEPLKYLGSDVWSRRLTHEHRCVYVVKKGQVDFLPGRYDYRPGSPASARPHGVNHLNDDVDPLSRVDRPPHP